MVIKNKQAILKNIIPLLIIILLCFWAVRSLFVPGFFTMHDDEQIARLFDLNNSVLAGQIPPRWVAHLGFGYGYPLFNFYPPFVYYIGEIFYIIGFSLINSTKIVMGLGFLLAAFFMYLWVKNRFGIIAGIVAAVVFTYAPYHGVDLYVRGALAEFFSFVCIPAVFWSLDTVVRKKTIGSAISAGVILSSVVLTHSLTALAFLPFLLLYIGYLFYESRKDIKIIFPLVCFVGCIGLGLSAYFWLPSLTEKKYTLVDQVLTKELADYSIHFVCPNQFWNSPWGYGGSIAGCNDGLSFQVGKIQILLSVVSLIWVILLAIRKKTKPLLFPLFIFLLLIFSLYMTTAYAKWIWDSVQPLSYIQFPWRFLLFTCVFSSMLSGFFVYQVQKITNTKIAICIGICIIAGSILLIAKYFVPAKHLYVTDTFYTTNNDIEWRVSNMSYEYAPKGVAVKLSQQKTTEIDLSKTDIPQKPYTILSKNMDVSVVENKPQIKTFMISSTGGVVQVNTFSFPGWQVFIDGKLIPYSDTNRLKLITFSVPSGKHTVIVTFNNTFSRSLANTITLITLVILCICCVFLFKNRWSKLYRSPLIL